MPFCSPGMALADASVARTLLTFVRAGILYWLSLFTCVSSGGTVDSVSGSCSTERGGLFHFLVVLSLTMSYCVTDGDEPAKAPEAKKKTQDKISQRKSLHQSTPRKRFILKGTRSTRRTKKRRKDRKRTWEPF